MKIILGSAQFGMNYGINNQTGQPSADMVMKILSYFASKGGTLIDSAYSYGESEIILGRIIHDNYYNFKLISKYPDIDSKHFNPIFMETLRRLKVEKLYGYMMHYFRTLLKYHDIWGFFLRKKYEGKIEKIGFSLYHPKELIWLLDHKIEFDFLQVPYNILDQRFDPFFPELKSRKIEIHVRSVFLQGLFFKSIDTLSPFFDNLKNKLRKIKIYSENKNISLHSMLLNFVLLNPYIDYIVLGVNSLMELKLNLKFDFINEVNQLLSELKCFSEKDEKFILPSMWN